MARPGFNPPYGRWLDAYRDQLSEAQMVEISRWHNSVFAPNTGTKQLFVLRDWIADRRRPMPDLLFFYGNYGRLVLYSQYFIRHRHEQPLIRLSEAEQQEWRQEAFSYAFTTKQMADVLHKAFNGFCQRVVEGGEDLVYQMTKQQLEAGLNKLDEMLSGDLAQKYAPTQYTAEEIEAYDHEDPYEENLFAEPLELRSLLEGTMAALPVVSHMLRLPHPGRPEYGLPRAAFADKLEALAGDETRQRLNELDDRLRQLLEFWHMHKHTSGAEFTYSSEYAPELPDFWWYHWSKERRRLHR